jgi:predicted Zn-dependent protease/lipoprotein NlpI
MDSKPESSVTNNQRRSFVRPLIFVCAFLVIALCRITWFVKTEKTHLHLPLLVLSGKHEYLSINFNENCVDLLNYALAHDKAGETDLATLDFKDVIASPGFKSLPDKLKITLIELAETRDTMSPHDYFDELLVHSRIGYWTQEQMPLRVYVPDETHEDGFGRFDRQEIERCFVQWCAIMPERLSFKLVDKPAEADIVFSQKSQPVELSFSGSVLAHTIPLSAGPERWGVLPASKATIEPLRLHPDITDSEDKRAEARRMVLLHEIGHSLGIIGHSANAGDMMFFSGAAQISERDKATLRRIYAPGSITQRAEKALRERAMANDKYALIQLATQLDECGTASQSRLQEIYRLSSQAADMGSSRAKLMLGYMYRSGSGVKRDLELASKYFHEACTQGSSAALLALSSLYERGDGVAQDLPTAEKYLKLALQVDLSQAPAAYGNFLSYQYGDSNSQKLAAAYYKIGCKNGQIEAMSRLALLYEHGEGVAKDLKEAAKLRAQARQQVLQLKATDAQSYFARACAQGIISEPEAIADFTTALRLKPDFRTGYLARAAAFAASGNSEAACLDLTSALKFDPACEQAYLGRSFVNLALGNTASSLKDVNSMLALSKNPDSDRLYGLMVGSLACRILHDEVGSRQMLDEAAGASSQKTWPGPIIRFLHHQIDESEFRKEALGYSRATEVRFYMAMDQSLGGKISEAINNLRWVKDNGDRTFYEYPVAIAELDRLQKSCRD